MRRTGGVLVLLVGMLLAACSNETTPPPPAPVPTPQPEPSQLVVGVGDLPPGFNPHLRAHQSPVTTALATLVLPSVFRYDASGQSHLDTTIATSAKVVATEPFTVSYELNLEAAWSTNTPIAAEDFVYLWEHMRGDPGVVDAAGYRLITEVRSRAGGKAVDVVFSQPYPQWQRLFSDLLPAHLLKDAPGSWVGALAGGLPASGGPFRIITVDPGRGEILLGRNDLYWDTPTVLDELRLRSLDDTAMAAGMASGDVDVALPEADPAVRNALAGLLPPPHLQTAPQPTVTQLVLRTDGGPLSDPRVRLAIASLIDRAAVRSAVAPEALPADAFGIPPSQAGYASTAPASLARPDPSAAAQLLAAAAWSRDLVTGRWNVAGAPARLVIGAAAERKEDVKVAEAIAKQLDAAGIGVTMVAPTAVELFGQATVPPTPPSSTPTPTATPGSTPTSAPPSATATPAPASPSTSTATTSTPSPTTATAPPSGVAVDLMVAPRPVGADVGSELASDFGCPPATTLVPDPPRSPTRLCNSTLQPLLDELVRANPRPEASAEVEKILWQQLPALPLYQPVTLVASTAASDAVTGVGPGPIGSGPVTGAERWRPLPG